MATTRQRQFLYGFVYKILSEYIGEPDIQYVHRYCMWRFAPCFDSLKDMNRENTQFYIKCIMAYFMVEHEVNFPPYELL